MNDSIKEPDWNILFYFGLPMNIPQSELSKFSENAVNKNIILASHFLIKNRNDDNYNRYFDAFKAVLLALKIHYPTKFLKIEKKAGLEFTGLFDLNNISGRDIKLRNICLFKISEYYKGISKK